MNYTFYKTEQNRGKIYFDAVIRILGQRTLNKVRIVFIFHSVDENY